MLHTVMRNVWLASVTVRTLHFQSINSQAGHYYKVIACMDDCLCGQVNHLDM